MNAKITRYILISMLSILVVACGQTLPEKLAGTWRSTEIIGDPVLNANNFEMQLSIKNTGEISIIAVNNNENPPQVERGSGKIEGEYVVLSNQEYGKLSMREDRLEITDVKSNKTVVFNRVSE